MFEERPENPPSLSQAQARSICADKYSYTASICRLLVNKPFMLLVISYGEFLMLLLFMKQRGKKHFTATKWLLWKKRVLSEWSVLSVLYMSPRICNESLCESLSQSSVSFKYLPKIVCAKFHFCLSPCVQSIHSLDPPAMEVSSFWHLDHWLTFKLLKTHLSTKVSVLINFFSNKF